MTDMRKPVLYLGTKAMLQVDDWGTDQYLVLCI